METLQAKAPKAISPSIAFFSLVVSTNAGVTMSQSTILSGHRSNYGLASKLYDDGDLDGCIGATKLNLRCVTVTQLILDRFPSSPDLLQVYHPIGR